MKAASSEVRAKDPASSEVRAKDPASSVDVAIVAADGVVLAASLYQPTGDSGRPVTIISPATGITRRYYARFATFLAEHGRPALVFDYRGIGGSLAEPVRHCQARYRDWGIRDTPAVLEWVAEAYPGRPIHWVGHSYGGFAPGLAHNNHLVSRLLGVATMSADYRMLPRGLERWRVMALLFGLGPVVTRALGYAPGRLNGSADLPKQVLLEWAQWCQTEDFLFGVPDLHEKRFFAQLTAPVRLTYIPDDPWVGRNGVEHLLARFPAAAERSIWQVSHDAHRAPIGHTGFFKPVHQPLWTEALSWLDQM